MGDAWQNKQWTVDEVERAFEQFPDANIGIQWGPRSQLIDIEADTPEQEQAFAELFDGCRQIPVTPTYKSTRGKHRLFRYDERLAATGKAVVEFKHLGIRLGTNGKGAHSVIPPSTNREWLVSLEDCDPAALPELVIERILTANGAQQQSKAKSSSTSGGEIPSGKRNETLTSIGGSMRRIGLGESAIAAALWEVNIERCKPRVDPAEIRKIAESVSRYAPDAVAAGKVEPKDEIQYRRITSAELDAAEFQTEYLIDHTLVAGQPCIIDGPKKALKTTLMIDLAISLSSATSFLGSLNVGRAARVTVMTGESGMATVQETARRVCLSKGLQLADCNVIWSDDLPLFGRIDHMDAFRQFLVDDEIEVAELDPAYLAMPGADAGNLMIQGQLLRE